MNKFRADLILDHVLSVEARKGVDYEYPAYQVAVGYVYNDTDRNCFINGAHIRTSPIVRIYGLGGEIFMETKNTVYRILKGVGYKED